MNRLQQAISMCQAETAEKLLQAGQDPSARDRRGNPIIGWLASSRKCDDAAALATAKVLDGHGVSFQSGSSGPSLLVQIASRGLPTTLAFLCRRSESGDPTQALRAIARRDDLASIRVLLSAGADPLEGPARTSALLDAAAAGQGPSVSEMLEHVQDKQSPKVLAAYAVAIRNQKVAQIFLDAGVRPPEAPKEPRCKPRDLTASEQQLLGQLALPNAGRLSGLAGGLACKFIQECGDLILIDCNSAADGPAYYLNQKTSVLAATCGGACMTGCTGCPPKEWTCTCE